MNNPEKHKEIARKTYYKNREKILLRNREWAEKHPEKMREMKGKWDRSHRDHKRLDTIKYREKKKQLIHKYTLQEWKEKLVKTTGICPMCNKYVGIEKLTLDHIIPVSKAPMGFVYSIDDVQPLCKECNSKKNNKIKDVIRIKGE